MCVHEYERKPAQKLSRELPGSIKRPYGIEWSEIILKYVFLDEFVAGHVGVFKQEFMSALRLRERDTESTGVFVLAKDVGTESSR